MNQNTTTTTTVTESAAKLVPADKLKVSNPARHFRMVASKYDRETSSVHGATLMFVGQRISGNRVPTMDDERKCVEKLAAGRPVLSHWDSTKGLNVEEYGVFRGSFSHGEYRGRASTWHRWFIVNSNPVNAPVFKSTNFDQTGQHSYCAEASSLQFPVEISSWPSNFFVNGIGSGKPFVMAAADEHQIDYRQPGSDAVITIFND